MNPIPTAETWPDVFISYSRSDSEFVHELDKHLKSEGRNVWVDWEDIAPAADWQQEIYESIDRAKSLVFVISARSLTSEYCGKELIRALEGGKRIIPIARDDADPTTAPAALAQRNWIWCKDGEDHADAFAKLASALETDLEWVKEHTRLLVRANEWKTLKSDRSVLLRGRDLADAERVLAANAAKEPMPTELQLRYVNTSRRNATARLRLLLGGVVLALAVAIVLAVVALNQKRTANTRARIARAQAGAIRSEQELGSSPASALAAAVGAEDTRRLPETETALRAAILANPIAYAFPGSTADAAAGKSRTAPRDLTFADHGRLLVGLTPDGTLREWRSSDGARVGEELEHVRSMAVGPDGALLSTDGRTVRSGSAVANFASAARVVAVGFAGARPLALVARHGSAVVLDVASGRMVQLGRPRVAAAEAEFSSDGSHVLTQDAVGTQIQVWDAHTGRLIATLPGGVAPAISADGSYVATACCVGGALWSVSPRRRLATLPESTTRVVFSPSGTTLAAIGNEGSARLYTTRTGLPVTTVPDFGAYSLYLLGSGAVTTTSFEPAASFTDDDHLAVANSDGFVRVWQPSANRVLAAIAAGYANALAFGPDGLLASMAWNGDVVVARLPASFAFTAAPASALRGYAPSFDGDRARFVVPTARGVLLATGTGVPIASQRMLAAKTVGVMASWAISADGSTLAASTGESGGAIDESFRPRTLVWRARRVTPIATLPAASSQVMLSRDGSLAAFDGKAWRTSTGMRVHALDGIRLLSTDGTVAVLRRNATAVVVQVASPRDGAPLQRFGRLAPDDELTGLFSEDDTRLLTSDGAVVRLWDATSGHLLARVGREDDSVDDVLFTRDGDTAVVLFGDRVVFLDSGDGRQQPSVEGQFGAVSPDGRFAVSITANGAVQFVDLATKIGGTVQPDSAAAIQTVWFGATDSLLFGVDASGGVHRIRCAICASDDVLLARARAQLGHLPHVRRPPIARAVVG